MRIFITILILIASIGSASSQHIIAESPYKSGASFPGGMDSLNSFLAKNIKYPNYLKDRKKELEEIITIEFTVKRDGWIEDISIRKGKNPAFKKEARRLVRAMPRWKAAEMEGKVVNETIILPIRFRLELDD